MKVFVTFICLCLVAAVLLDAGTSELPVLQQLYNATDGDNWVNNSGWSGSVEELRLPNNGLAGDVSALDFSDFLHMAIVDLQSNSLTGTPPLFRRQKIEQIQLASNQLSGAIPADYATYQKVSTFNVSRNHLVGPVIAAVANIDLSPVQYLDLSHNNFTSDISGARTATSAYVINLNNNYFTGSIPDCFLSFGNLQRLNLCGNNFTSSPDPAYNSSGLSVCFDSFEVINASASATNSSINNSTGTTPGCTNATACCNVTACCVNATCCNATCCNVTCSNSNSNSSSSNSTSAANNSTLCVNATTCCNVTACCVNATCCNATCCNVTCTSNNSSNSNSSSSSNSTGTTPTNNSTTCTNATTCCNVTACCVNSTCCNATCCNVTCSNSNSSSNATGSATSNSTTTNSTSPAVTNSSAPCTLTFNVTSFLVYESGRSITASVVLSHPPTSTVTLFFGASDATQFSVAPSHLLFDSTNWNRTSTFTVTTLPNNVREGNQTATLSVLVSSSDSCFDNRSYSFPVTAVHVPTPPAVATVFPLVSSTTTGAIVTVTGTSMDYSPRVYVRLPRTTRTAAVDATIATTTDANDDTNDEYAATILSQTATALVVRLPTLATQGYVDLIVEVAGVTIVMSDAMYYTANCPFSGQYGVGTDCNSCPPGGECPGGDRVWPSAGYWATSEFGGGDLFECFPAIRCTGGRFSNCSEGYTGARCGSCISGYVSDSNVCVPCSHTSLLVLSFLLLIGLFAITFVVGAFASVPTYARILFLFLSMQLLWIFSLSANPWASSLARIAFSIAGAFGFDIATLQPQCLGLIGSPELFLVGIGVILLSFLLVLLAFRLSFAWKLHRFRRVRAAGRTYHVSPKTTVGRRQLLRQFKAGALARLLHVLTLFVAFVYPYVLIRGFQMWNCRTAHGVTYMMDAQQTVCLAGAHLAAFLVSILAILLVVVGFPLFLFLSIRFHSRTVPGTKQSAFKHALYEFTGLLLRQFGFRYTIVVLYLLMFGSGLLAVFAPPHQAIQGAVQIGLVLLALVLLLAAKGFLHLYRTVALTATLLATLLGSTCTILTQFASGNAAVQRAVSLTSIVYSALVFAILALVLLVTVLWFLCSCIPHAERPPTTTGCLHRMLSAYTAFCHSSYEDTRPQPQLRVEVATQLRHRSPTTLSGAWTDRTEVPSSPSKPPPPAPPLYDQQQVQVDEEDPTTVSVTPASNSATIPLSFLTPSSPFSVMRLYDSSSSNLSSATTVSSYSYTSYGNHVPGRDGELSGPNTYLEGKFGFELDRSFLSDS